ncbi:hypothetical protein FB451DRAFT_1065206 [Mycena latifolia]|nr:hypothetical protein FB451DRAFT_1065206 [Mycena latifolia]
MKTSLDMPLRRSKEAPKTFKGKYSEVDAFLRHYDKLLRKCHVTDAKEQCELIIDYCSTKVAEYIKSEEHYISPDWVKLREEIRNYYDAEKVDQRYLPADLSAFTRRSARKACHTLGQWKTYYRKYKAIAGNMGKNKMEEDKIAGYFWLGIHVSLRKELNAIIRVQHPNRDTSKAPAMAHVKAAAEEYFKRDQFPANLLDARDYGYYGVHELASESSGSDSCTSDSDTTSEDSDSEEEGSKKWKKRFKEKLEHKKKGRKEKERHKDKHSKKRSEFEEIIEKLNTMNIRDPHHGSVYYKAIKMDPLVAQCIHREPLKIQESIPTTQRQVPPHMDLPTRQAWSVEAAGPATYPNNIPQGERPFNPACFGCGKTDHRINNCMAISALTDRGLIRRHPETGRLTTLGGMGNIMALYIPSIS